MGDDKKQMREQVIEQVLKVNPRLAGEKSPDEFTKELMASVKSSRGKAEAQQSFTAERFTRVFKDMLDEFAGELDEASKELDARGEELEVEGRRLKERYRTHIADFLAVVQPGELTDQARAVLREHLDFFKSIDGQMTELSRELRQRDLDYQKQ